MDGQAVPQSIFERIPHGEPVTVPVPVPAFTMSSLTRGRDMNVAVTVAAELMVTTHGSVPEHPPPDQPAEVLPTSGAAVRVTAVLMM